MSAQTAAKKSGTKSLLAAPPITIDSVSNPSPGYIFMATWDRNVPAKYGNYIFVLDKNGAIVDSVRVDGAPYDFQVQPNGLLSYALGDFSSNVPLPGEDLQHVVLDENLVVVDSFKMKNGYTTDFHEFKMLPNGNVMMMAYHTILYDMSQIVEGGQTDASLVINIIQEQDREKNVVFEWRNIDYIPITDSDMDLTEKRLNYSTLNAFNIDDDGNILASFRNHSEIMKISRSTGEIIWRMGGPRGEFTFIGEHVENAPYYFARQHNIRKRPNGNITLFDNGQYHQPPYSRAVEYSLDEVNKVATLVTEWRYPKGNIFCVTAGNAELLSDGGWFIGYGVPNQQFVKRNAVEVKPDGSIALELNLPDGVLAYRVTKLPWRETLNKQSFTHYEVREGNTYSFNNESITTGIEIKYSYLVSPDYNESKIIRVPYAPVKPEFIENIITVYPVSVVYEVFAVSSQTSELYIDLSTYPEIKDPGNTIVYYRSFPNQGLFIPLATTYDSINNKLITTLSGVGEIAFGVPVEDAVVNIPIMYEPLNKQELVMADTVTLRWTGKGQYNSFNVQFSDDSTFTAILNESNTNLSAFTAVDLVMNTDYYWRVNSVLGMQTSQWSEVWSFKLNEINTAVIEFEDNASQEYCLAQNYPNPFNISTKISYSLKTPNYIILKIYDQVGKEVRTLVSKNQNIGKYSVNFDGYNLPQGIYFYRLQAGNQFAKIKKMLLTGE
ncbi:MAG: T9SS type A sorting domain-containing protein [Bacteroidetes bacterium]|nr:T9SS type A sorting domain-containing protein [Bacteroidota bacterium]MBT4409520.1 T9SS type A sorting domain-containing protein [Bacteroidota bacterium]MBT7092915.1 T9SS type A sorting domain-containing protein [Bacteroidota bacterium]MBT7463432.1 T9SS type A sorting domain-containing protein [Bacteroidota bacterium]